MWTKTEIDAGKIKEKSTLVIAFQYEGIGTEFQFRPSCGCTSVHFDAKTGNLSVTVKVSEIPFHLRKQGNYELYKTIYVSYKENDIDKNETLIIKAIVE